MIDFGERKSQISADVMKDIYRMPDSFEGLGMAGKALVAAAAPARSGCRSKANT